MGADGGAGVEDRDGHRGRRLEGAAPAREDEETTRVGSPAEADEPRIALGSTLMPTAGSAFSWSILFLMAAPYAVVGAATTSEALPGQGAGAPEAGRRQHRRTGG